MTLAERMAAAGPNEIVKLTNEEFDDLRRRSTPCSDDFAGGTLPARRRALFDRIIAMDLSQLAAMERCAGMIEGQH